MISPVLGCMERDPRRRSRGSCGHLNFVSRCIGCAVWFARWTGLLSDCALSSPCVSLTGWAGVVPALRRAPRGPSERGQGVVRRRVVGPCGLSIVPSSSLFGDPDSRPGAFGETGLGQDAVDMAFGGALGDHEPLGDLLVGQPLGDQFCDLSFPPDHLPPQPPADPAPVSQTRPDRMPRRSSTGPPGWSHPRVSPCSSTGAYTVFGTHSVEQRVRPIRPLEFCLGDRPARHR
ncbi:hypothetical protein C8D87_103786 [Lentzea atacamensis]|uniref:Uncharacterized protein n=1 Tax=Lentzea atacamensis TaxID=531938 RepID=A0ABX9EB95_9PSEU|nr:hypothetical protein C8D87_103786 [Lentzea atacamensis]